MIICIHQNYYYTNIIPILLYKYNTKIILLNGGLLGEASVSRDENDSDKDEKLFST